MSLDNIETMDTNLLFSIINMKLRNDFRDLEDLCQSMNLDQTLLQSRLASAGFKYTGQLNRFNKEA